VPGASEGSLKRHGTRTSESANGIVQPGAPGTPPDARVRGRCERDPPVYRAEALTMGTGTARIELDGQLYTMRITRQRKLILNK
jgi:hemin uptake protein HemP